MFKVIDILFKKKNDQAVTKNDIYKAFNQKLDMVSLEYSLYFRKAIKIKNKRKKITNVEHLRKYLF